MISHGWHFDQMIHAFCNLQALMVDGLNWISNSFLAPNEDSLPELVMLPLLDISAHIHVVIATAESDKNIMFSKNFLQLFPAFKLI